MKYEFSEEAKSIKLKNLYWSISMFYVFSIPLLGYTLLVHWDDLALRITLSLCFAFLLFIILLVPKNLKNKLSIYYELKENELLINEGTKPTKIIQYAAIKNLKKSKYGYNFKFNNSTIYISPGINNEEQLFDELNKKVNEH